MTRPEVIVPDWPAPPNVRAASTTRFGGVSTTPWDTFNVGLHCGDDPAHVRANRTALRKRLGLATEPCWLDQRHGTDVVRAAARDTPPAADACVAHRPGAPCVVLTADCLPVLLCARDGSAVGAAHGGWRGLAAGVIEAAVAATGLPGERLHAWLGPCIGPDVYEIDAPVRDALLAADAGALQCFAATRPGHWTADLPALARRRLEALGVHSVHGGRWCTFSDRARFFSYRRDGRCGRMATLVWLVD